MTIPRAVQDFPGLIQWLVAHRHRETPYQMAQYLGVSSGTVDKWLKGVTRQPSPALLVRLAEVYDLDLAMLMRLSTRRPPIAGTSAHAAILWAGPRLNEVLVIGSPAHAA